MATADGVTEAAGGRRGGPGPGQTVVTATNLPEMDAYVAALPGIRWLRSVHLNDDVAEVAAELRPDVLVWNRCLPGRRPAAEVLARCRQLAPATRVVLLLGSEDAEARQLAAAALGLGVFDILAGPVDAGALEGLLRVPLAYADVAIRWGPAGGPAVAGTWRPACLVCWSPKGGGGATRLAAGLLRAAVRRSATTPLGVDCHLAHPHLALRLGLPAEARPTVWEGGAAVDLAGLQGAVRSSGGVELLPGPAGRPELAATVAEDRCRRVLELARAHWPLVVADVGPDLDLPATQAALAAATDVLVICGEDPAAQLDTAVGLRHLAALGVDPQRVHLVGRAGTRAGADAVGRAVGWPVRAWWGGGRGDGAMAVLLGALVGERPERRSRRWWRWPA